MNSLVASVPLDAEALIRLNDAADLETLQARGRLVLPRPGGGTFGVELHAPSRSPDALIEAYWRFHPRYGFFKGLAPNARLADLGAGSGGTIGWKLWGEPARPDLFMYAIDRIKGEHFERFVDYDIVDLEREETKFPDGAFDAVLCSHVLDFVRDRAALAHEAVRICRPGGRIYVEWPNAENDRVLSRFAFAPFKIPCGTLSIEDDPEQVASIGRDEARSAFEAAGTKTVLDGEIANDFMARELIGCGIAERNEETMTYGLVLALRLSRFLVLEKR